MRLGARELRTTIPTQEQTSNLKKNPIYIILDNVLDTYNVGGIFRLADAVAAEKVFLCGETQTPPNSRIKKASINTTEWIAWQYSPSARHAIENLKLKVENLKVIAIEQSSRSIPYNSIDYRFPVAFVVGHETNGVSKEVLEIADTIVEIPMWGVNRSLNVIVSLAIVLYEAVN